MKKSLMFLSLALISFLYGCKKEENFSPSESNDVVITYSVCDDALISAKSAYDPSVGVKMTGNEPMGVYFYSAEDEAWNKSTSLGIDVKAPYKATGAASEYSFSAPAGTEALPWYAIVPYTKAGSVLATGNQYVTLRFSPVQNPGANTFDPQYDILFSEKFTPGEGSATINSFKRIFTPLCVKFTGLNEGEKIYAASILLDQPIDFSTETSSLNSLAAVYSVSFGDTYETAGVSTVQNKTAGNGVSAICASGLEAVGSEWPVWYMVHDMSISAGTTLTATVTTGSTTYAKTIVLPSLTIRKDALNKIGIDMSPSAESVSQKGSVLVPFTTVSSIADGNNSFPSSTGSKVSMTVTGSGSRLWVGSTQDDSGVSNALNLNNRSFTVPTISGKKIVGVRVYTHAMNNYKVADTQASYLTLKDGDDQKDVKGFNLCPTDSYANSLYSVGGFVDFSLPEGAETMSGMTIAGNAFANLVSAVTFFTEDVVVEYKEASENDLYTEFSNTENKVKITINGVEYKNDETTIYNDDLSSATASDLQKVGLHFITGSYTGAAKENFKLGNANGSVQYISRYQDNWASISVAQIQPLGDVSFKKMKLTGTNGTVFMPNSQSSADISVSFDNCNITSAGALIRDVNATGCYKNIIANDCTISVKGALYYLNNKSANSNNNQSLFKITGCTISAPSALSVVFINPGQTADYNTPGLELVFTGNTMTNISGNTALMNFRDAKKITISNNTISAPLAADSELVKLSSGEVKEASTISGNTLENTGESSTTWKIWSAAIENITESGNTIK